MNSVERVKAICSARKIPISRLEKDLGFSNGYIGQLRKGTFPYDRLVLIAKYLGVPEQYLSNGDDEKEKTATDNGDGITDLQKEIMSIFSQLPEKEQRLLIAQSKVLLQMQGQ